LRRLSHYDLAVIVLVIAFSFLPFIQPTGSWQGYGSFGSHFYKNNFYEIHYSDINSGVGKPQIYLATKYDRTPLIEVSDHTSKVNGLTLYPNFKEKVRTNSMKLQATYSVNNITLTKTIEPTEESIKISYMFDKDVNFSLTLWRWYYNEVGKVTKYNWKISKIQPTEELDFTFQSAGELCRAKLLILPKPEEILVEGDPLGINKIVLNFQGRTVDLQVSANANCSINSIVSSSSSAVYPVIAGVISTGYLGIRWYTYELKVRNNPINIRGGSSPRGFLRKPLTIAVIGSGIRLVLAPFFMHAWDVITIQESLEDFISGRNVYASVEEKTEMLRETSGVNANYEGYTYLPHPLLIYAPFYLLYKLVTDGKPPIIGGHLDGPMELIQPNIYLFLMLIKLPIIAADATIIYLLVKRSFMTGMIYAFLPYSIAITSIWGNFDSLSGLLLMLTAITIDKKPLLGGILFGLSTMKIFILVALPTILLYLYKQRKSCVMFLIGLTLSQIPTFFFLVQDLEAMLNVLLFHTSRSPGGVNIFHLATKLYSYDLQAVINKLSLLMLGANILTIALKSRKNSHIFIVSPIAAYMVFGPVTNEQHLAALIPSLFYARYYFLPLLLSFNYLGYALTYSGPTYFMAPLAATSDFSSSFLQNLGHSWTALFGGIANQLLYAIAVFSVFTSIGIIKRSLQRTHPEHNVLADESHY
jgi:hypothetical protein